MIAANEFERKVEGWVNKAVAQNKKSLNQILISLPGVYPSHILNVVRQMKLNGETTVRTTSSGAARQAESKDQDTSPKSTDHSLLPIPHPLDYEWRFCQSSISYLIDKTLSLTRIGDTVALLGVPSVFHEATGCNTLRHFVLLDKNSEIIRRFRKIISLDRAVQYDALRDPPPDFQASVVLLDPPWYEAYFHAFLWSACQFCELSGYILLSLPKEGTRPGFSEERIRLLKWCHKLGLNLIQTKPSALRYISPPFESNALKAAGIHSVPKTWRSCDLAIFRRVSERNLPRPEYSGTDVDNEWREFTIKGVRFRVRPLNDAAFRDPRLKSLVPGDILPTVSRRDPGRQQVDVWTSGNRVFACDGLNVLELIFQALACGTSPHIAVSKNLKGQLKPDEAKLVSVTSDQINRIIDIEEGENLSYGGFQVSQ